MIRLPTGLGLLLQVAALSSFVLCGGATARASGSAPTDDQKGRYLNFEVGALRSVVYDAAHGRLLALNQPGNRLAVLDPVTLARTREIPIGLGGASLALRPGTQEVWIVDRVYACVTVVNLATETIERTIRVPAEPHGIAFSTDGSRAWVTCTGADTIASIDTGTYRVARATPTPFSAPRGVAFHAGRAWVASLLSGNNTAAAGTPAEPFAARELARVEGPGVTPLPDLDLVSIVPGATPALDDVDAGASRAGLGTILFDVVPRPGKAELWIPGTEALNAEHRGERSFVEGQVVSNRITIVGVGAVPSARILDLDLIAPPGVRCAQPTSLVFDPVRPRVYVCGYGSDLVAVLEIQPDDTSRWLGHISIPAKQSYPRGSGPRSCAVDPEGTTLWVFNRNDTSIARIDLAALPASGPFAVTAPTPVGIGFAATSTEEQLGRHLFTDARNSGSQTSSCASCHVDGNTDNLLWDLSEYLDPEGTPASQTVFGLDVKGPLLTQGTRRQEESGPYHWRGEKRHLNHFNAAFVTLLDRVNATGQPADIGPDFQYLRHYLNRMAIPANPRQNRDRSLTPEQALGADLFRTRPVLGTLTCASCHTLPLGTGGEVAAVGADGVLTSADVPALRGVGDREQPALQVGGPFGERPRGGAAYTHAGVFARLEDAFARVPTGPGDLHAFALAPHEAAAIAAYLRAFDTGLAPSTAWQVTARAANWAGVRDDDLAFLKLEAERGNCDLVFFRTPGLAGGGGFVRTGAYDKRSRTWRLAGGPQPVIGESQLLLEAAAGRPVTFLGVPRGMGLTIGLDRDADGLMDADEVLRGTNPDVSDTDGDHFPDGYEVRNGGNPLVHEPSVGSDTTPPQLVGPVRLIYATTNTIKFEFVTSEYCRVHVGVNGGTPVQRIPLDHQGDTEHWVVLNDLQPGTSYVIDLEMRDPSGNRFTDSSTVFSTRPRTLVEPVWAESIQLTIGGAGPTLFADVRLKVGAQPAPPGYMARGSVYRQRPGRLVPQLVAADVQAPANANGHAIVRANLSGVSGPPGVLFFVLRDVEPPPGGGAPYVRAYSDEVFDTIVY